MTVHMIQLDIPADAPSGLVDTAIPNWLAARQAWQTNDPLSHHGDGGHYRADWRFEFAPHDRPSLLDTLENVLNGVDWYRIRYHECDHDEPAIIRDGCSWDETRTGGTVPAL